MQTDAEVKAVGEQAKSKIETLRQCIGERRVEHDPVAVVRAAKRAQFAQQALAMPSAAPRCIRDQIVDVDETAVNQVVDASVAGERHRLSAVPYCQQPITLFA